MSKKKKKSKKVHNLVMPKKKHNSVCMWMEKGMPFIYSCHDPWHTYAGFIDERLRKSRLNCA